MKKISHGQWWGRNKIRLKIMFDDNPHCFWCGEEVEYFENRMVFQPNNMATVDHLFSNTDGRRKWYKKNHIPSPIVLSCYRCNHERDRLEPEEFGKLKNTKINFDYIYY